MTAVAPAHQVFRLPDLGEGLTEAEILEWRVQAGDTVETDQIVVEVETAKAAVEVPVPYAGRVLTLHGAPGSVVGVGDPLISIATVNSGGGPDPERSGSVLVGYGTGHTPAIRRRTRGAASQVPVTATPAAPRVISPVVRRLAQHHGVDLRTVAPSERDGVIRRRDVDAAIDGITAAGSAERIALTGLRRSVADKLSRSRSEIPDATTWVDVDATALLDTRETLRTVFPDQPIGLLALLARICVAGLTRFPDLNAAVDPDRREIVRHPHINLGFAAQSDRGLVVPVVRGAHLLSTVQIQKETARLTELARSGRIPPAELVGGTFTLNNYGVFGVDGSVQIINHPEAAILGVGRIVDKPWVHEGRLTVRKVTQLSLSFDHRVCDGGVAAGFLRFVADCVRRPVVLLAHL